MFDYVANFTRFPDYILEETAKVNGKTWAITAPRLSPLFLGIVVSTPENVQVR